MSVLLSFSGFDGVEMFEIRGSGRERSEDGSDYKGAVSVNSTGRL